MTQKKEFLIDKKKLKKIRTFRDQLMTTAGGMAAYAREDNDGTVAASAIDKNASRKASIALTEKMCRETVEKNMIDQTWDLIITPGYLEQCGSKNVFKSQQTLDFEMTPSYEAAFQKGPYDRLFYLNNFSYLILLCISTITIIFIIHYQHRNLCIQRDPLREWSEMAVKSGIKIFQSGGSIKI